MTHLCDANVFIAIAVEQHADHDTAAAWFRDLPEEDTAAFCRASQTSFLRLLTQRISEHYIPLTNQKALEAYDALCQDDAVIFALEPAGLERKWRQLAGFAQPAPKLWMDAYLAAFAMAGGFRMTTLDQDFERFRPEGLDLLVLRS